MNPQASQRVVKRVAQPRLARYRWLYHRLRTMTLPEVGFRLRQYVQKRRDRAQMGWQTDVRLTDLPQNLLFTEGLTEFGDRPSVRSVLFDRPFDPMLDVDWHLDLSSGRRFPMQYAKNIDIRTEAFGNAKYIWEVNRMGFLPALALAYRESGDPVRLAKFCDLLISWVHENPYLTGVNWYSNIEVNLRLINWFFCWNILEASALAKQNPDFSRFVSEIWVPTIYQHCVYSRSNPSFFSSANNHLIAEYAGLFIASSFWKFTESAQWNAYAKAGLECEMQAQHCRGVNREETATYIQFITDFFLLSHVVGLRAENRFSEAYADQLRQIARYIADLLDCRGHLPHYGDEDNGRVVVLDDRGPDANFGSILTSAAILFGEPLFKARAAGFDRKNYLLFGEAGRATFGSIPETDGRLGSAFHREAGHFILRNQESDTREFYVHFDAAPLGYLSIAAHGHADALSLEVHVDGRAFLVDAGTYTYHVEPVWRNYFVSTRAHNTVCIDGQNQAHQAGPLLWLRHYDVAVLQADTSGTYDEVSALHSGYESLDCQHQRTLRFDKLGQKLWIRDRLVNGGTRTRRVEVLFHLHPAVKGHQAGPTTYRLSRTDAPGRTLLLRLDPLLKASVVRGQTEPELLGWYSDGFARKGPTSVVLGSIALAAGETLDLQHTLQLN